MQGQDGSGYFQRVQPPGKSAALGRNSHKSGIFFEKSEPRKRLKIKGILMLPEKSSAKSRFGN